MYQSTTAFGNLVQQDSRTFKCLLTYDKVSITKVKSIKLTGGSEARRFFSGFYHVTVYRGNDPGWKPPDRGKRDYPADRDGRR